MTSQERFDAWANDNKAGLNLGQAGMELAWIVWQARDDEVRELVEALRECRNALRAHGEFYASALALDLVAKTDRILAKYDDGLPLSPMGNKKPLE